MALAMTPWQGISSLQQAGVDTLTIPVWRQDTDVRVRVCLDM